ncbi:MAG: hypothetical protein ACRDQ5_24570 [Sciscionella sp.]
MVRGRERSAPRVPGRNAYGRHRSLLAARRVPGRSVGLEHNGLTGLRRREGFEQRALFRAELSGEDVPDRCRDREQRALRPVRAAAGHRGFGGHRPSAGIARRGDDMSVNTVIDTGGIVRIPGLPTLSHNRSWHPASVRWVAITPSGAVEVHTSDNQVALVAEDGRWLQWRMVLDIAAVLDPANDCVEHRMQVHEVTDDGDGMVLEPCLRHSASLAYRNNLVATALIAGLERTVTPRQVRGTVVWLGNAAADGVHASITNNRVTALRDFAQHAL